VAPDPTDRHPDGRPVLSGLAALVVAALGIVVVAGAAFFVLDRVGGGDSADDGESGRGAGQELVIPSVSPKAADDEPVPPPFTDTPRPTLGSVDPSEEGSVPAPTDFTLTAGSTQVPLGGQLDLTGTFPGAEGTQLQVERLSNGTWAPFPVNATVQPGGTYSTYITSSVGGEASFRMTDPATQQSSNEVEVTIG